MNGFDVAFIILVVVGTGFFAPFIADGGFADNGFTAAVPTMDYCSHAGNCVCPSERIPENGNMIFLHPCRVCNLRWYFWCLL